MQILTRMQISALNKSLVEPQRVQSKTVTYLKLNIIAVMNLRRVATVRSISINNDWVKLDMKYVAKCLNFTYLFEKLNRFF